MGQDGTVVITESKSLRKVLILDMKARTVVFQVRKRVLELEKSPNWRSG